MYGVFTAMTAGVALLPASVICGLLWERFGNAVPFVFGASKSAVAAIILMIFSGYRMKGEDKYGRII